MNYLPILTVLLSVSCSTTFVADHRTVYEADATADPRTNDTTSEELQPYVDAYEERYDLYPVDIPTYFAYIEEENVAGRCTTLISDETVYQWIEISIQWYDKHKEDTWLVRWLVFHELAHCYNNEDHRDRLLTDGRPASIMNSILPEDGRAYELHYQYYEYELLGY